MYIFVALLRQNDEIMIHLNFFSLNQVEQADVIMAEYREGWAARAEKVISLMFLLKCDQVTFLGA